MTSWIKRIENVATVLKSIIKQTVKPDLIEVNLSLIEFPNKYNDLPKELNELIGKHNEIEINWLKTNDYSFKKIIPTIKKFFGENYYLISIDDDYIYFDGFVEQLIIELEKNNVDAFNFSHSHIFGNKQIYKSECFKQDFWELLTQEVINTKHDDLYIYSYLINSKKKIYNYMPYNAYQLFDEYNPINSISDNGFYSFEELENAKKIISKLFITKQNNMKYLKNFKTVTEKNAYISTVDYISYVEEVDDVYVEDIPYEHIYLTYIPSADCTISFSSSTDGGNVINESVQYSTDNGETWVELLNEETTPTIPSKTKIMFKGDFYSDTDLEYGGGFGRISCNVPFNVEGNIMSLFYGDDFINHTTMVANKVPNKCFAYSKVVDASHLILPATTLTGGFYIDMFRSCTGLTQAPQLPATTLGVSCYQNMFYGCTSLTTAPSILPATTLAKGCYQAMFQSCTSLTTAPELPAKTLETRCYLSMFNGCTNLNSITMLATDISATSPLTNWVSGVAANGTFIKDASMTTLSSGASGIPTGWTVEDATE